jgi:GNAT superfamily N-acetyltransferase
VRFGFVHACEQNHLQLATVGGGSVVQLESGKAVTNPLDPVFVYNFVFGVRRALDLDAAAQAFRAAGRDYVHVLASPSSGRDLPEQLGRLGFREVETQAYRWAPGTGAGAPGLLELGPDRHDEFLRIYHSAWGVNGSSPRDQAVRRRLADPRSRAYRSADGNGVFLLFTAGTTTQLAHFGVAADAQGQGLGRRMLQLATGLVAQDRPLWLFTARGGSADRGAGAAGWELAYTAGDWLLDLPPDPST